MTTLHAASKSHGSFLLDIFYIAIYKVQKDIGTSTDLPFDRTSVFHVSYLFCVALTLLTLFPIAIREEFQPVYGQGKYIETHHALHGILSVVFTSYTFPLEN